jgi:ribosomal protein S18 acetylase RimI-like enzyme
VIDRAGSADLEAVVQLLDAAALWQRSLGIDLWHPGTFEEDVRTTIAAGDLYVAREQSAIIGCFMLDEGSPRLRRWLAEHGREPDRGVVGRLTVARQSAGRGLGLELLREAGRRASQEGVAFLRLECAANNEGLRRYYGDAGFTYCGDNEQPGPNGERWVSSIFERPAASP